MGVQLGKSLVGANYSAGLCDTVLINVLYSDVQLGTVLVRALYSDLVGIQSECAVA